MTKIKELFEHYKIKKNEISKRLKEFESIIEKPDEEIFAELAFCILTPQSKATTAWNVIQSLTRNKLLYHGSENQIRPYLNAVRFADNKTKYLIEVRNKLMKNGKLNLKEIRQLKEDPVKLREWLVENIKGYGMKEASHFIRNIGLSKNQLAILDVHILRTLKEFGVIDENTSTPSTKKKYLEIEAKMKDFSKELGIQLDELDIALWSKETGFIFK